MSPERQERSPEEIRAEVEETREELGETVAAVAAKTDVKGQAQAKVDDLKQQAKELGSQAKAAAPESPQEAMRQAQALTRQNPKPLAIVGAIAALLILWRLLRR
jgi:ElaB/YqjD/DUF883 family membrane-anchored ribosome-binding protein